LDPIKQDDQIGRIFANWVAVYLAVFGKLQKWRKILDYFPHGSIHVFILTMNGSDYILGGLISSGHPVTKIEERERIDTYIL
jgi:hypothetical protein